jgi:hypothetical protein
MQSSDIESYTTYIDEIFSKIVKSFNKIQLEEYNPETLKKSKELIFKGSMLLNTLQTHVSSMKTLLADCSEFIKEMQEDLTSKPKEEGGYVYHTKNGMLGYPGKEFIINSINPNNIDDTKKLPITYTEQRTLIPEIGYYLSVARVSDLKHIPPAIYYYSGDQPGLYMRLSNNNLLRIPFPETIDSKKEYNRKHSIRCKYHTKAECDAQRLKMSKMYKSTVRTCNFAHKGDSIIKIGYPYRCPAVPEFGNPTTMSNDIKYVTEDDIKNLLLYSLSDLAAAAVWFDYSGKSNLTITNLDFC